MFYTFGLTCCYHPPAEFNVLGTSCPSNANYPYYLLSDSFIPLITIVCMHMLHCLAQIIAEMCHRCMLIIKHACAHVYLKQSHVLAVILLVLLWVGAVDEWTALLGVTISC